MIKIIGYKMYNIHIIYIFFYRALAAATSVKSKRFYFGTLKIATSRMSLSMMTASKLSPDLQSIKKSMSIPLIKFEDAKVDLGNKVCYVTICF